MIPAKPSGKRGKRFVFVLKQVLILSNKEDFTITTTHRNNSYRQDLGLDRLIVKSVFIWNMNVLHEVATYPINLLTISSFLV